jgi:phosphatidate cytidylyltransferase
MVLLSPQESNLANTNFIKRTLSAAIGGPIAVGAVILGSPYVDSMAFILLGILLWEWSRISRLPLSHPINAVIVLLMGWSIFGTGTFLPAFLVMGAGFFFILFYHYQLGAKLIPSIILLSGSIYIGFGMTSILNLAKFSPLTLLWALAIVWSTDTAAYVVGSLMGGPKLVPRISPGKTWAGFIGGSMIGTALGITLAPYCQIPLKNNFTLLFLTLLTTFVGHTGDILESAAKRLFNVKDSSHIIPGHGGLLDRIDSLLLVALFFIILRFFNIF